MMWQGYKSEGGTFRCIASMDSLVTKLCQDFRLKAYQVAVLDVSSLFLSMSPNVVAVEFHIRGCRPTLERPTLALIPLHVISPFGLGSAFHTFLEF